MSKYDSLRDYLQRQTLIHLKITFDEIESILQAPLPPSAKKYPEWWANEDPDKTTHVQCKSWKAAGYDAFPDIEGDCVVFERVSIKE